MGILHEPQPQSTPNVNHPPLNNLPTRQIIVQIASLEAWRVDLWLEAPGSQVYGLPAEAVASFVGDHLNALRTELRRREEIVEAAAA